jgi:cell division septum initiation protein DivIVA
MNWMTKMKADNRELKKKVKQLEKELKEKDESPKTVVVNDSKRIKVLKHKLHNVLESNHEFEGIINRFAEENNVLREGELEAQRAFDREQEKRKIFKAKAVRMVKILNKWLGDMPTATIEKFKDSPDYDIFVSFYNKYVKVEPAEVNIDDSGNVKEV